MSLEVGERGGSSPLFFFFGMEDWESVWRGPTHFSRDHLSLRGVDAKVHGV